MPSFDVVSQVDTQEIRNAVDQSWRDLRTRFDFKKVDAGFEFDGTSVLLWAEEEFQLGQLRDILRVKLAGRGVDVQALQPGDIEALGKVKRQSLHVVSGIETDICRKIVKLIKDLKLKVQSQIQAEQVRVMGKKRDDLQQVIATLREAELGIPIQFKNFRD
ncbi:MAG: YajQ family cyclic di-GMP-binding protein [Gammaproteobacteria bacterium]|nr:YajQ family cyclic di-GMP-binding protein [Gammaproteobacteria bacterium]